jgi:hypothetical protein
VNQPQDHQRDPEEPVIPKVCRSSQPHASASSPLTSRRLGLVIDTYYQAVSMERQADSPIAHSPQNHLRGETRLPRAINTNRHPEPWSHTGGTPTRSGIAGQVSLGAFPSLHGKSEEPAIRRLAMRLDEDTGSLGSFGQSWSSGRIESR